MKRSFSQSALSNINSTKCIVLSLCIWFLCVIIFITRNKNEISNSNIDLSHPFAKNNIPKDQQISNVVHKKQLSYTESLSPELVENGWKPIYIHSYSARMPAEEMDYLLEQYWYPHIKELNSNKNNKHETVDNLDLKQLKSKKKKSKLYNKILIEKPNKNNMDSDGEHHKKLRSAPSTTAKQSNINPNSELTYPKDWSWSSQCLQNLHSTNCIYAHMKYWQKGIALEHQSNIGKPKIGDQYVTFLRDCGGFNNIRQSFEFHAMVAWVTGRTLVIPPDMGWYLIDFGQITRGKSSKEEVDLYPAWPDNKPRRFGVSNYDIWFDMNDMSLRIPVITTAQFIKREFNSLQIPMEFSGGDIVGFDKSKASAYQKWLNQKAADLNVNCPWGQLSNLLYWPDIKSVESKNSAQIDRAWVDNRKKREYTSFLKAAKFIHFPSCALGRPGDDHEYRYLGQIARSIAFDSQEKDRMFRKILRDHIHLKGEIMEYAAMVVSILGAFNYASFHIRRNDLQYPYVFAEALDSFNNVRPLIDDNEVLYIATDETKPDFFGVFEENGKRKVYRWKDFFGENAQFEATKDVVIPGKWHGEVEMAICAMGRIFFGTKESTFSSYIGRLRGYFGAPFSQTLYHHYKLTSDVEESSKRSKANPGKPYSGQIYKIPFPDLWEIDD